MATITLDSIVHAIVADEFRYSTGASRKYPRPDDVLAQGDGLMDMLLPNGKTLGNCTGSEVELVGQAYKKIASTLCPIV